MHIDANQERLLTIFSRVCETRKTAPLTVQPWVDAGLIEEIPDTVDHYDVRFGQPVRCYRLTSAGAAVVSA